MLALLPLLLNAIKVGVQWLFSFFSKPPGLYLLIIILAALGLWWFGQHEFNRGRDACEAAHRAASQKEVHRQVVVAQQVATRSEQRTAQSQVINLSNEKVVQHVKDQAAALPTASDECVSAALADELRDLK